MAWKTKIHGKSSTRIYRTYSHMKERCTKENHIYFKNGIRVCDEWLGEKGFIRFYAWAILNGYDDSLTLDRIDNSKGYCPENCRWVDYKIQNNNTSRNRYLTYKGEKHTIAEWADLLGIKYGTLDNRIRKGVPSEIALMKPVFKRGEIQNLMNTNEKEQRRV